MDKGKYEYNYYTVCGAKTTSGDHTYWAVWLDNGGTTGGFSTAKEARIVCDRIADKQEMRRLYEKSGS